MLCWTTSNRLIHYSNLNSHLSRIPNPTRTWKIAVWAGLGTSCSRNHRRNNPTLSASRWPIWASRSHRPPRTKYNCLVKPKKQKNLKENLNSSWSTRSRKNERKLASQSLKRKESSSQSRPRTPPYQVSTPTLIAVCCPIEGHQNRNCPNKTLTGTTTFPF